MAGATGDIIRITDNQTYLGQTCLNVYFYAINDTTLLTGDYLGFISGLFKTAVITPLLAIQGVQCVHNFLYLENLTNGVDIKTDTDGFPQAGGVEEMDGMPPFVSWGFQLIREERNTRNGYKRFAGVNEENVTDGVAVISSGLLDAVSAGLGSDLTSGLVTVCNPVIVRHPITVPLVSPVFSHIGSAVYKHVGTQNTRKFNRGV